jgi:hypothetical protein
MHSEVKMTLPNRLFQEFISYLTVLWAFYVAGPKANPSAAYVPENRPDPVMVGREAYTALP